VLTSNRIVKLMDFGIARSAAERSMTQTGTTLGSVNYMSPEQITGQTVDARSDVYSTGISLYEIVTGQRPFNAPSDYELMAMHVKESPKPPMELRPWLPSSLNEIILTAIAKDPQDRFQSADAFRDSLLKAQGSAATGPLPFATQPVSSARLATVVESSRSVLSSPPAAAGRERTQVATRGSSGAQAAQPAPLAKGAPAASGRRSVYIAAGAVLALAAIGAPAIYLTNHHASTAASSGTPPPDNSGATTPVPSPPVTAQPAVTKIPKSLPNATVAMKGKVAVAAAPPGPTPRPQYAPPQTAPAPATAISPELQKQLDALELRIDTDTSHAAAINNSLNTMQSQMQKDGMSLRGDVASQQSSMNLNLSKAQKALEAHDAERADRFAGLAETDIAQLQKFLGR
jgi:serine/threonine-protein kinase